MPVPFADQLAAVQLSAAAAGSEHTFVRAEPHRAALVLHRHLIIHQVDHRVRRGLRELARARAGKPTAVARELHHRQLHAETDAEERHAVLTRVADGVDLPLGAALTEAARY